MQSMTNVTKQSLYIYIYNLPVTGTDTCECLYNDLVDARLAWLPWLPSKQVQNHET